jgi:hypothetical protein
MASRKLNSNVDLLETSRHGQMPPNQSATISSLISVDKRWDWRGHGQTRVLAGAEYLPDPHPGKISPLSLSPYPHQNTKASSPVLSNAAELSASTTLDQLPTNPVFYHTIIQSQIAVCAAARFTKISIVNSTALWRIRTWIPLRGL